MEAYNSAIDKTLKKFKYSDFVNGIYKSIGDIREKMDTALESMLDGMEKKGSAAIVAPKGNGERGWYYIFLTLLIVGATVGILYVVFRYFKDKEKRSEALEIDKAFELLEDKKLTLEDLLNYSDSSHDKRIAMRYRYIALLWQLNQRADIKIQASDTNIWVLRKINNYYPELHTDYKDLLGVYEEIWFGKKTLSGEKFDAWLILFEKLFKGDPYG